MVTMTRRHCAGTKTLTQTGWLGVRYNEEIFDIIIISISEMKSQFDWFNK